MTHAARDAGLSHATIGDLLAVLANGALNYGRPAVLAELRNRGIHTGHDGRARGIGADLEPGDLYGTRTGAELAKT